VKFEARERRTTAKKEVAEPAEQVLLVCSLLFIMICSEFLELKPHLLFIMNRESES
jgi:hypothetical protein